jgi:hypothetical protein
MDDAAVKIWEQKGAGVRIDMYSNGKIHIWFDQTCEVTLNTGKGPREGTGTLYGFIEIAPRAARGTRALDRPAAPTIYDLDNQQENL